MYKFVGIKPDMLYGTQFIDELKFWLPFNFEIKISVRNDGTDNNIGQSMVN